MTNNIEFSEIFNTLSDNQIPTTHSSSSIDEVLDLLMELIVKNMNVEAGSVLILDPKKEFLTFQIVKGTDFFQLNNFKLKISEGIAGWVAKTGEPLLVKDVSLDERFAARFDDTTGFKTKSILCVPMKIEDHIIGVLEVINRKEMERDYK